MKIILPIILLLFYNFSISQLTEGYIQYDIDVKAIDTLNSTKQKAALLRDSKMELYFAEKKIRIDFKMGQIYRSSIRINKSTNAAISLMDSRNGKYATLSYADEIKYNNPDTSAICSLINETKTILGFNCKKAIVTSAGKKSIYWYTTEIDLSNIENQFTNPILPGFPMKFSKEDNGMMMTFTASNFMEKVKDKVKTFSTLPPKGYQISK